VNETGILKAQFCFMKQTNFTLAKAALILVMMAATLKASAQDWKSDERINLMFGLSQPILASGFNIEGNFIYDRFIFDYSHGVSLDFKDSSVPEYLRQQGVAVHMPYTTGFGLGYRITEWLNIRVEPKWHRFEFYYEDEPQNKGDQITAYDTFSLGAGLYGAYRPFKKQHNFLKGFLLAPSVRFWPTVHSSLQGEYTYLNKNTQSDAEIKTLDPGILFTPLVINLSVGYTFGLKKN
jgi:hypothetical protein